MSQIISISTVAYDGYPLEIAFEHIKNIGLEYVEVAFIKGYIEAFSEDLFSKENIELVNGLLEEYNLNCYAFSAHIDLGDVDAIERMKRRIEFANNIGAKIVITNAALRNKKDQFYKNIDIITAYADKLNMQIGLENPGDGKDNIINNGKEAAELIKKFNLPFVKLNYDFGNLITHLGGKIKPEEDAESAVPHCSHFHIKDVSEKESIWEFPAIGKGIINYKKILKDLIPRNIPISLEVPVRLRRKKDGTPFRLKDPVPLDITDNIIKESLGFVQNYF